MRVKIGDEEVLVADEVFFHHSEEGNAFSPYTALHLALKELERREAAGCWRDMASAPTDGTKVLLLVGHNVVSAVRSDAYIPCWIGWDGHIMIEATRPNGWLPMPGSK